MRITLLHPPHTAIGSRIPDEHLPPFGLLCLGGPLIDAGQKVRLVNADIGPMPDAQIIDDVLHGSPDVVTIGHSGSTSAHPTEVQLAETLKSRMQTLTIVYGGVYPSYHWQDILRDCSAIDVIVRGEGEETAVALVAAIEAQRSLETVPGLAFRRKGRPAPQDRPAQSRTWTPTASAGN